MTKEVAPMRRSWRLGLVCAVAVVGGWAAHVPGQVLFRDDFGGERLDVAKWYVRGGPNVHLGPMTELRTVQDPIPVGDGVARLQLDTYNPKNPGQTFLGTQIQTHMKFNLNEGVSIRARMRMDAGAPGGLVGALFSFAWMDDVEGQDEIDVEILSNDTATGRERFLTNLYTLQDGSVSGQFQFVSVVGQDLTDFHEYEIRRLPDNVVQWWFDGQLVREERDVPEMMESLVILNLWSAGPGFEAAYNPGFEPTLEAGNRTYFMDVDYVEVARIPEPASHLLVVGLITAAGVGWRGRVVRGGFN